MERWWIGFSITLSFVSWALSDKVVLVQTPDCRSCAWNWDVIPVTSTGVSLQFLFVVHPSVFKILFRSMFLSCAGLEERHKQLARLQLS